eukprot:2126257-Rhodomonas_salina.3
MRATTGQRMGGATARSKTLKKRINSVSVLSELPSTALFPTQKKKRKSSALPPKVGAMPAKVETTPP